MRCNGLTPAAGNTYLVPRPTPCPSVFVSVPPFFLEIKDTVFFKFFYLSRNLDKLSRDWVHLMHNESNYSIVVDSLQIDEALSFCPCEPFVVLPEGIKPVRRIPVASLIRMTAIEDINISK